MASTEKSLRKDKNQNIQVFVRLRPLNQREKAIRSLGVVEVINSREVLVRQSHQSSHTKKFTFDRAFGPNAEQVEVYKEVVSPLIAEVLAGYNCTVFAYGQTGTGKTHTMVGESSGEGTTWQNDPLAGIIPRALSQLFDELRISNTEYTVRVSYLELYNEELFDLLSSSDDNSKLRIYEDVTRKGSTIVNGLEEITVYNKNEVYEIMAQGQERKKVASTLMNAQSSRSHTVFTIVVHMKENCPKGEELVKIGKLNLVDLAGSENISKAGSDNPAKRERARECVNINQSLLTLGRVITALVEKHPHIPYRESKLTRILQESLGGRTKTSIIATVSPGHKDLEETMSTLEYAHRAKNIQNKPEVNQKLTKQAILKEFAEEIDKLKRELTATREKNGVYLPSETYVEMTLKHDEQRREIQELLLKKRAMEEERARMEQVFAELSQRCEHTEGALAGTRAELARTAARLTETKQQCAEQEHLTEKHMETEQRLAEQARQLVATAEQATHDVECLHNTVDKRRTLESSNQQVVSTYREQATAQREQILNGVQQCADEFSSVKDLMQTAIDDHARDASMTQEMNIQDIKLLVAKMGMFINEVKSMRQEGETSTSSAASECESRMQGAGEARRDRLRGVLEQVARAVGASLQRAAAADVPATVARATGHWVKEASGRVQCLQRVHGAHGTAARALEARRGQAARAHHRHCADTLRQRAHAISTCIQEIEKDKKAIEERIEQQISRMESERRESEERLQKWMAEERQALEERLQRHAQVERDALALRVRDYTAELDAHKAMLAEATERCVKLQQLQLEVNKEEMELADSYLQECGGHEQESLKTLDEYEKDFGDGTSAITAEMEAFSRSVVHIVEHTNDRLLEELHAANTDVQQGVCTALEADSEASQHCLAASHEALATAMSVVRSNADRLVDKAEEATTSSVESLEAIRERTLRLCEGSLAHQSQLTEGLRRGAECVERATEGVAEALCRQAEDEGRYLMREFRVYSPTGNTPARREFRYPRQLAATSPHARILARFRANQHQRDSDSSLTSPDSSGSFINTRDNRYDCERATRTNKTRTHIPIRKQFRDCIVIESDEGRQTSDSDASESSVSEDSAVAMQ